MLPLLKDLETHLRVTILILCWALPYARGADAVASEFPVTEHRCKNEHGLGSEEHEAAINRLDGKRIVFIGDVSVRCEHAITGKRAGAVILRALGTHTTKPCELGLLRYQYLELAYFLSHGRCPNPDDKQYILDQDRFETFNEFYRVSSDVLNVRRAALRSREFCICTRLSLEPGEVEEQRSYVYEDRKGRKIEIFFEQYFQEEFGRLETILFAATALRPTDIVISYGKWQRKTDVTCGEGNGDAKHCVGFQFLCGQLVRKDVNYKIWVLTVPPASWEGEIVDLVPVTHHLHLGRRCYLPDEQVLDRGGLLQSMESEKEKLLGLWVGQNSHKLSAEAYHAFNRQFLDRVTPLGRNLTEPLWFDWLRPDNL